MEAIPEEPVVTAAMAVLRVQVGTDALAELG